MAFACSMNRVPRIQTYAEACTHFEKVRPTFYTGAKPIKGQRRYDNMQMRLHDATGAITFRLYACDCVVYYPDGTITINGCTTISTSAFIDRLAPEGISHRIGPRDDYEPVLELRRKGDGWGHWDGERYTPNRDVLVIKAHHAQLHYDADERRWLPVDEQSLEPFHLTVIDPAKARAASRRHHFADFLRAAPMIDALLDERRPSAARGTLCEVLDHLTEKEFAKALRLCPMGKGGKFGTSPALIATSYIAMLREEMYDAAGALSAATKPTLTIAEYETYRRRRKHIC